MPVISDPIIDRGDSRTLEVAITADDAAVDPSALTLTIRTPAGVVTTYTYGIDVGLVREALGAYGYEMTFTQAGAYVYEWRSTNPTQVQGGRIEVQPSPLDVAAEDVPEVEFASLDDLAVMLGVGTAASLTTVQVTQAEMLLPLVADLVIDAVGRDTAWALALDPVPALLRAVTLTVVKRFMDNPSGVRSESETLGQYQHSASYTDGAHGLMLTDAEVMLCRRAVYGKLSGSSRPLTTLDDMIELAETGEIAGSV